MAVKITNAEGGDEPRTVRITFDTPIVSLTGFNPGNLQVGPENALQNCTSVVVDSGDPCSIIGAHATDFGTGSYIYRFVSVEGIDFAPVDPMQGAIA